MNYVAGLNCCADRRFVNCTSRWVTFLAVGCRVRLHCGPRRNLFVAVRCSRANVAVCSRISLLSAKHEHGFSAVGEAAVSPGGPPSTPVLLVYGNEWSIMFSAHAASHS